MYRNGTSVTIFQHRKQTATDPLETKKIDQQMQNVKDEKGSPP